jgi:hypothetical protein
MDPRLTGDGVLALLAGVGQKTAALIGEVTSPAATAPRLAGGELRSHDERFLL